MVVSTVIINHHFGHPTFHRVGGTPRAPVLVKDDNCDQSRPESRQHLSLGSRQGSGDDGFLPSEIIGGEVLSFLYPAEVIVLAQVSKQLNQVVESSLYWEEMFRRHLQRPHSHSSGRVDKLRFFAEVSMLHPYLLAKGHDTPSSCRVVVHGRVYDVTAFLSEHPGGEDILLEYSGDRADATTVFDLSLHSPLAIMMMERFLLWDPATVLGRQGNLWTVVKGCSPLLPAVERGLRPKGALVHTYNALQAQCPRLARLLEMLGMAAWGPGSPS